MDVSASGKFCRAFARSSVAALALASAVASSAMLSGCNFFGKQQTPPPAPPGQLQSGTSVVGTWTVDFADVSTSDAPSEAVVMTYTFTGSGAATIDVRDLHAQGSDCTASGPYTVDNSGNVDITIQAVEPTSCEFPVSVTLENPVVSQYSLSYVDPTTNTPNVLYAALQPQLGVVGVWQFSGQGGIDWVLFDQNGYFLLQTGESANAPYLTAGYYTLSSGTLTLNFFDTDAGDVLGQLEFTPISNTGSELSLTYTTTQGASVYTGTQL